MSRGHAAKYDGSVGVVCHTHILDEKGGSSETPRTPSAYTARYWRSIVKSLPR